jgi:hypothetical protein
MDNNSLSLGLLTSNLTSEICSGFFDDQNVDMIPINETTYLSNSDFSLMLAEASPIEQRRQDQYMLQTQTADDEYYLANNYQLENLEENNLNDFETCITQNNHDEMEKQQEVDLGNKALEQLNSSNCLFNFARFETAYAQWSDIYNSSNENEQLQSEEPNNYSLTDLNLNAFEIQNQNGILY